MTFRELADYMDETFKKLYALPNYVYPEPEDKRGRTQPVMANEPNDDIPIRPWTG